MKFIIIFTLFFVSQPAISSKTQEKAGFWNRIFKTNAKPASVQKNPRKRSRRLLSKEAILASSDYYEPKKSKSELISGLNKELSKIEDLCDKPETEQTSLLNESLDNLLEYLESNLRDDPYMIYEIKLMFHDIKDAIKQSIEDRSSSNLTFESFSRSYRLLYNLPESLKVKDYPDDWAKRIANSLKCLEAEKIVSLPFTKGIL